MFRHSTNALSFISVLIVALIFSLSLAGLVRRRATPVWGQGRFRATPRATTTPPSEPEPLCLLEI